MPKYILWLFAFGITGCSFSKPSPVDFDFQGAKIGSPIPEEMLSKCRADTINSGYKGTGYEHLTLRDVGKEGIDVSLSLIDGRVEGVTYDYNLRFGDVFAAFKEKFGSPHEYRSATKVWIWHTKDGEFRVDESSAWIHSQKLEAQIEAMQSDESNQLKKSL